MSHDTLWAATVRTKSMPERIQAATAGGFTEMSIFPLDAKHWEADGQSLTELRELLAQGGVTLTVLDPLTHWLPRWAIPNAMQGTDRDFVNFDEAEFFRLATGLGVQRMSVIESFGTPYELDELVAAFARICDRAAEHDLNVQVEFMPFSGIPDLATAWEIVRRADRANGGLVFDTWHYLRGKIDNELLRQIPGEKIFSVQLADADQAIQGGSLRNDLMHYRKAPGDGDFDLLPVVRLLRDIQGLTSVGVEVFADAFDALPAAAAGAKAGQAMRQLLARL